MSRLTRDILGENLRKEPEMQYKKTIPGCGGDSAVSPVVGVMLMLVVVVIIAAIVSGFAGGMIGNAGEKAPTLTMDVKVVNMGSWTGSGLYATVTSTSKPIPTTDLKIVTAWTAANGSMPVAGGNTTLPNIDNVNMLWMDQFPAHPKHWIAPWGGGPGINQSNTAGYYDTNPTTFSKYMQQFGQYSLVPGTTLTAKPCGQLWGGYGIGGMNGRGASSGYGVITPFTYSGITSSTQDATMALFGANWEKLRVGDAVNIQVIYTPTGAVIFNKDIAVTEG